ncbi:TPA: hypothetical protein P0N76_002451 [Yersinia enterocolitica]|uniref:hypothetical protein n=1 Tax=Yersinia enterocolitica TaxID=630 RepID=UPI0028B3BE31|nr:hypothetical protein [Yersinia enterocolitica]ELI7911690.1 hypothetical protein [Yersinia enterocolitica]HDL7057191.1 hypothetical protein [Yersinia enterocolitica]HDL7161868.1 hypothetical protein [Yersinia enterocolitica]HDL7624529.1 hypothetical protein [Yersinia enterocolitica]
MKMQYLAQPIMSTDQKLLGVEVLTRFLKDGLSLLRPTATEIMLGWTIHEKRAYLIDVIHFITNNEEFFIGNKLFCSLSIDSSTALILKHDAYIQILIQSLPYLKLLISEGLSNPVLKSLSNRNNALFLNYLGSVNTINETISGFEVVKIDEIYFSSYFYRSSFPVIIENIIKYCPKIIVSGVFDAKLLPYLHEWGVWGIQGELYESVPLH